MNPLAVRLAFFVPALAADIIFLFVFPLYADIFVTAGCVAFGLRALSKSRTASALVWIYFPLIWTAISYLVFHEIMG